MTADEIVKFSWSDIPEATYTLKIQKYENGDWIDKIVEKGITQNNYTPAAKLAAGGYYRATVTAYKNYTTIKCQEAKDGGIYFQVYLNPESHPANAGIDYDFENTISELVLNNYLDRAVTCEMFTSKTSGLGRGQIARNNIRMFLNTGVKYVSRAYGSFNPSRYTLLNKAYDKSIFDYAHSLDSDIIFEAGIYEAISTAVNGISIPKWVFDAFGKEYENRCFNSSLMVYEDGRYTDEFGEGLHAVDITRDETQMLYYYLACNYIDIGIEALHFGQTRITAEDDNNYACCGSLFKKVREYAKTHARRGMVLINSHNGTKPLRTFENLRFNLLVDFLAEPAAIYDVVGEAHLPSENNPQKAEIREDAGVWTRKYSGYTPSGWYTTNLPCYAEFDNWMSAPESTDDISFPTGVIDIPWGMDEISWFANQPSEYRHTFMNYMYDTVKSYNSNAHVCFPASRPAYIMESKEMDYYYILDTVFYNNGFSDEKFLKELFINSNS